MTTLTMALAIMRSIRPDRMTRAQLPSRVTPPPKKTKRMKEEIGPGVAVVVTLSGRFMSRTLLRTADSLRTGR